MIEDYANDNHVIVPWPTRREWVLICLLLLALIGIFFEIGLYFGEAISKFWSGL